MKYVIFGLFSALFTLVAADSVTEDIKDYVEFKRIISKARKLDRHKDWNLRLKEGILGYSLVSNKNPRIVVPAAKIYYTSII